MKRKVFSLAVIALLGVFSVFAGSKSEKITVQGNCGMCEARIEKAAKAVSGVTSADWNKESKTLAVAYDDSKTDIHKVHMAVAKAGHDTNMQIADNETYNKLHGCCKYERASVKEAKPQSENSGSGCPAAKKTSCCG